MACWEASCHHVCGQARTICKACTNLTLFAVLGPETYMLEANGVRFIAEQARAHATAS